MPPTSQSRKSSLTEEKSRTPSPTAGRAEAAEEGSDQNGTETALSTSREVALVFLICVAQLLARAGLGQSIAPMSVIGRSFGVTDEATLSWYPAAFSLTFGTFILPAGRLGDMYGHRNMFMLGFAWYAVSSVVAGLAVYSGNILFSVARAAQGIGCALFVPNTLALLGRAYKDSPRKNMVFGLFGAAGPVGSVMGTVFSSLLAQLGWWPWAYFAMAVVCVLMIVAAAVVMRKDERHATDLSDFDFLGCGTGVSGLILFNFAWNQAAVIGWTIPYTYILLVVGLLLLIAFAVVETRVSKHPLVPLRGFKGEAALVLGVIAAGWGSFGIWFFYLWRLLENLRGYTPLAASAQNAPIAVSGLLAAVTTGFLLSHIKVSYVLLMATIFFLVGQILIATVPVGQTYWAQTFVSIIIMPWGMDLSFPSGTIILSNSTRKQDQGIAASLINTTVNYSISLGLGIAGTIVRNADGPSGSTLEMYRGARYFGIGLDICAFAIALYFVVQSR